MFFAWCAVQCETVAGFTKNRRHDRLIIIHGIFPLYLEAQIVIDAGGSKSAEKDGHARKSIVSKINRLN